MSNFFELYKKYTERFLNDGHVGQGLERCLECEQALRMQFQEKGKVYFCENKGCNRYGLSTVVGFQEKWRELSK